MQPLVYAGLVFILLISIIRASDFFLDIIYESRSVFGI